MIGDNPNAELSQEQDDDDALQIAKVPPPILHCGAGREVFSQGTPSNHAFIVEKGELEVLMEIDGHTVKLAEIGPGEIFGEMGVLEREDRMATVKAITNCTVRAIDRADIEERIKKIDDIVIRSVLEGLTKRLRNTSVDTVTHYKNLANFQSRMAGIMEKADQGIDQKRREDFAEEIAPLLDQVEAVLDKYRQD